MVPRLPSKQETKWGFELRKSACAPNHCHIKHLLWMITHNRGRKLQTWFDLTLQENCERGLLDGDSGGIFSLRVDSIESEEARLSCVQLGQSHRNFFSVAAILKPLITSYLKFYFVRLVWEDNAGGLEPVFMCDPPSCLLLTCPGLVLSFLLPCSHLGATGVLAPGRALDRSTGEGQDWACVVSAKQRSWDICTLRSLWQGPHTRGGQQEEQLPHQIYETVKNTLPGPERQTTKKRKGKLFFFFPVFWAKVENFFFFFLHWVLKIM